MFSGHALLITAINFGLISLSPKRYRLYYKIILWALAVINWSLIIASRAHYSIDVILAIYITSANWALYDMFVRENGKSEQPGFLPLEPWKFSLID